VVLLSFESIRRVERFTAKWQAWVTRRSKTCNRQPGETKRRVRLPPGPA